MRNNVMLWKMAKLHRCINYCSFIWGGQQKKKNESRHIFILFRFRRYYKKIHLASYSFRVFRQTMYCHDLLRLPARELADEVTKMITYFSVNLTCQLRWKNRKLRYEISIKKNQEDTLVLTALSKMYEKIFVDQMYCIFINHFSLNMSGFLKQHFLLQRPSENY